MRINDKIRFIRMEKGWSQEVMAEKLNMAIATYSNIERGITDIQSSRLEQIAHVFNMELLELLSFGEKGVVYLAGENGIYQYIQDNSQHIYHHIQNLVVSQEAAAFELQKMQFLVEQQTREITYLKEIIELMKRNNE
jgi:transcriptional regulator with XRE-family HTH domain